MFLQLPLVLLICFTQAPAPRPLTFAGRGYPSFGTVVGKTWDVDKDGIPDMVIGDPGYADEGIPPTFWIISGKDGTVLHRVVIPEDRLASYSVDGGADIDGDGVPDLVIGAAPYRPSEGSSLFFVSGKSGTVLRRGEICVSAGGVVDRHNGNWIRFVPDFNGDGIPDVAALCPKDSDGGGDLVIRSGRTAGLLLQIPVRNECRSDIGGFVPMEDVDSDGVPDFAVLIDGQVGCGATLRAYSTAKKSLIWEHRSDLVFGDSAKLAALGDLDTDGVRDLAVSFGDTVVVVSGRTGEFLYGIESAQKGDSSTEFGWEIVSIGDIDRDDVADFALSETDAGMSNGRILARSGVDGHPIWIGAGEFDNEAWHVGYELAALGDIDGDGICDLIAGTCGNMSGEAGLVRVFSGKDGSLLFQFARKGDDVLVTRRRESRETPR
jgi:hypothetical protein